MAHLLELDPDVTAVVSSGYGTDPVMSEWIEHGFSGVLAKPYKLDEVSRVLAEVVAGEG